MSSGGWPGIVMDVDRDGSVRAGVAGVLEQHGSLDGLVACAGWALAGAVEQTPIAEAKDQFETNFWGAVRLVQAALPVMRAQGSGRIVLMSSMAGVIGLPFHAFYSATKFAMEGFGEALAYEVAPFGIDVTLVEPGNVRSGLFASGRRGAAPPEGNDPYRHAGRRAAAQMEKQETAGATPDAVAGVVQRVLEARHPPRRVTVGSFDERVGVLAKRLVPHRLFERTARGRLGV
jgi:NAD(P)-dependent dehydrogenase (short-subunit alcohol dehydrogenase family)